MSHIYKHMTCLSIPHPCPTISWHTIVQYTILGIYYWHTIVLGIYYCAAYSACIFPSHTSATSPPAIMLCRLCHVSLPHHCNQRLPCHSEIRIAWDLCKGLPANPPVSSTKCPEKATFTGEPKTRAFLAGHKKTTWDGWNSTFLMICPQTRSQIFCLPANKSGCKCAKREAIGIFYRRIYMHRSKCALLVLATVVHLSTPKLRTRNAPFQISRFTNFLFDFGPAVQSTGVFPSLYILLVLAKCDTPILSCGNGK